MAIGETSTARVGGRFRVLRAFCLGGGVDVKAGEIITLEPTRAPALLATGKVERIAEAPAPTPAGVLEVAGPALETRDAAPAKGRGRRKPEA